MSKLEANATYIYERVDDIVYAREAGKNERFEIGRDYDTKAKSVRETVLEDKMWGEIRRMAQTDPTLQDAVDRVIMIYKLSKEYKDGI